jgi:hypothetical protein
MTSGAQLLPVVTLAAEQAISASEYVQATVAFAIHSFLDGQG